MPSAVVDQIPNSDDESFYSDDDDGNIIDGIRIPPATKPTCSFDPTGPRLIITKITNSFFKSYANETILGPFHKCFNAIVGPNGSGKSNVIDSMLFVFGYRATKIRSKKISVLIHNSGKFKNVQSCTVTVHFAQIIDKEGDEYDIIPGSEFSVSRTANKDNSSFYTLNDKRVHFKEVAVVLKGHGIDLDHNRFLILQGEVEQISMMKSKAENENECGMLEYLEDIIGTTRYKKPLLQVFERLEYLAERRTEKINRLQIVEREMDQWKQPMEEAVGFLKTENSVVINRNFLYQYQIYSIKKQIVEIEQEHQTILDVQKEFEEKLNKIASEQKEKEKLLKQKLAGYEHLNQRKEQLTEAYNNANNQDVTLQQTFTDLNTKRKKTKELIISEGKRIEKLKKVPEESEQVIADCEQKIQKLSVEKEKLEEEKNKLFQSIRKETEPLHAKKDVLQNELIGLNETTVATKSEFTVAETELKTCLSKEESEKAKLDAMTEKYHSTQTTIEERTKELSTLKNKIPPTEKSLNSALQEFNATKQEEVDIVKRIKSNRDNLEEKKNSMQASSSRGRIVNALMKEKRDGNCPGLYGRLGDLGGIDLKYDIAISTACGSLDCIVVDTVDTAQWCIEHLKQYNLGRATFISLDKQEHLRELANSKIRTPENVPRLYDLIRVQDETVKTAFYYSLRNTLVADDIEQATRIAYGQERFRVVTLNGNIIETSGTMSGGGKQVSRGRMGQSVRVSNVNPRELESLQEDITEMEQHLREIKQKEVTLENQINVLQPELTKMKANFEQFRRELEGLRQQQPVLERQLKEQEAKTKATKADPAQVKKLTKIVEIKKQEYEAAATKSESIQKQIDKISEEIAAKSSGQMKVVEKKLKEAISGIAKAQKEITRLQVAVTIAERDSKKAEENLKTMQQDVIDYETKLKEIMAQRTEIEEDATKLLTCLEEISTQLAEAEELHGDMKKEVQALVKKENDLKSEKIDVDRNVKNLKAKLNEYNGAIHQQEVLISRLKLQEIPNEPAIELKKYSEEELEQEDSGDYQKELEAAEKLLKAAKPNLSAIDAYKKQQAAYLERSKELEEIVARRQQMRKVYDDLKLRRREEFISGYNIIRMKLKEMYQMITLGGDADFEMVDTYDPFSEGIQLNVRPPKKSWKKISNLSGGEKTLSSLALVFALHYYKPSPLYVMDEIDAALDFKNVSIVGNYIQSRTKNAQFIIISLRSNMFELCDNLVGIYKVYDCTHTACIDPRVYDEVGQRASQQSQQSRNNADGDANTVEQTQNISVEAANTSQQSIETNQQENNKTDVETNQQENNETDLETNQQQSNEIDMETNQQENNQTNMEMD